MCSLSLIASITETLILTRWLNKLVQFLLLQMETELRKKWHAWGDGFSDKVEISMLFPYSSSLHTG